MSNLFIVAAPSGCGKTSLVKSLINDAKNLRVSISHTTRNPRVDEVNGTNYHFVSVSEFQKMVSEDSFIEHAEVFENFYGTSKKLINDNFNSALTDLKSIISSSNNLTKCVHLSLEVQSIKHKKLLKKLI